MVDTMQFEALKVALKQDKTGYVLTLSMHPDEIPETLLRDFVGARYQVVMVRLNDHDQPMQRQQEFLGDKAVQLAAILSKDPSFWEYLHDDGQIIDPTEEESTDWLREYLGVKSRSELKMNDKARGRLEEINRSYMAWKQKS